MPTLYLDMDGVLADFNHAARIILGASPEQEQNAAKQGRWPDDQWSKIKNYPHFYRDLPKTDIADKLVELGRKFRDELGWRLLILTAIPKGNDMPEAFHDKVEWIQTHYPDLRVHFGPYSKDKQHHAEPGDYLVDDRVSNCREWESAGGIAVKVDDLDRMSAVAELEAVYRRKQSFRRLAGMMPDQG